MSMSQVQTRTSDTSYAAGPAPYDPVAVGYDQTRRADPRLADAIVRHLAAKPGGRYLDVGCGTGNYLAELVRRGYDVTGLDLSQRMLDIAQTKAPNVRFVQAPVERTPLPDGAFAGAFSCLAIHHFKDLEAAAREMHRVLRDDGALVIFTTEPAQTRTFWLNFYFPDLMRASETLMPPICRIAHALQQAGFAKVEVETWMIPDDMTDYFLYGAKHQPALYLRPEIRHGITRFRNADPSLGVAEGCARLARDVASGRISEIIAAHPSTGGDYSFVVARKSSRIR